MPKCFAVNCYTRSENGSKLFLIPQGQRNTKRRKVWLQRMGRKEEEVFQSTRLCEFHFTPDQFEMNRKDGVVKLKPSAVPTIFNPRPAKDILWKGMKRIEVKEPTLIKREPGLEADTNASSSYQPPRSFLQVEVKVEPEEILGHSNDEENSIVVEEEFPFQEVKAEPSETPSNENLMLMASSSSDFHVDESSNSAIGELESDVQEVIIRKVKKKNGEIAKVLVRRKLKCPSCGKAFPYPSDLRRHILIHAESTKKLHKCTSCVMSFTNRSELSRHLATHKGKTPLSCYFCDKSFMDQSTLKQHAVIHTGQRPYKCSCGTAFKRKNNLKRHQVEHIRAEPYYCTCCMKSFSLRCELEVHMKEHSQKTITSENVE